MIVVIGQPFLSVTEDGDTAGGLPARIAFAAAAAGADVQLVGKVGEDDAADAVLLALARGGVGHVAVLRDGGGPTGRLEPLAEDSIDGDGYGGAPEPPAESVGGLQLEAPDVDLALRYLTDFAVVVLATPGEDLARVVASAVNWAGAHLVAVVPIDEHEPPELPADSIVFEAPEVDPDGAFATMVGSFAAALDAGEAAGDAFRATVAAQGWTESAEAEAEAVEREPAR
jgi:ribokinase